MYMQAINFNQMLMSSILTVLFTVRNIVMHCVYFGSTSTFEADFEKLMRDDMKIVHDPLYISPKWQLTQDRVAISILCEQLFIALKTFARIAETMLWNP